MWWTTICRCRVSDHLGTDPYATFVVMSILSERCHLVFTDAGGKVGVSVLPLRCVLREKKLNVFCSHQGQSISCCVLCIRFSRSVYIYESRLLELFISDVETPSTLSRAGLGVGWVGERGESSSSNHRICRPPMVSPTHRF